MNNRLPVYILIALVGIAIIYRIANPPQAMPPGPVGDFPGWKSRSQIGEMAAQAVNPSGTKWAGVWNEVSRNGEVRTAVWFIDFRAYKAKVCKLQKNWFTPSLGWVDDRMVRVLTVDNAKPAHVTESKITYIDSKKAVRDRTDELKTPVRRVLAWPQGDGNLLAEQAGEGREAKLALMTQKGEIVGKQIAPKLSKDAEFYTDAAITNDGNFFVFSVSDPEAKGGRAFYTADVRSGGYSHVFDLADVPGRIEGMWVASVAGPTMEGKSFLSINKEVLANWIPVRVLMVCSKQDDFCLATYESKTQKISALKGGIGDTWPDAPKSMMFVTYNGGYRFDLATGKSKKLFDFDKLTEQDKYWRQEVRNGRLYPMDNHYISVSMSANSPDIRELAGDGTRLRNLLPRL